MNLDFSIIIPVYNRPEEIDELLQSIVNQQYKYNVEVIIIEDGSSIKSDSIIRKYKQQLDLKYFFKENSGPGDSRNYGMKIASGNYFIILDSDCILPKNYLQEVRNTLQKNYTDAFGGADASHPLFTDIQKAISYSMTSFLTTGGIRGSKRSADKFQLRSFNMGISKESFLKTKGFSKQHYGEDIDLTFKLWKLNFTSQFIEKAFVYHKRRSSWKQFYKQTFNFGAARPILNKVHPKTAKMTFWFPSIFVIGIVLLLFALFFNCKILLLIYSIYLILLFGDSYRKNKSFRVALLSVFATLIQFIGYGLGFLRSIFRLKILSKTKEETFPEMFAS